MAIYFTSDTHFGHSAIIELNNRPFASADEMDETLIARWNEIVAPDDIVYHLGDFCCRDCCDAGPYLKKLNGRLHLIEGNHDEPMLEQWGERFASVSHMQQIHIGGQKIILCHYPIREWNDARRGAWHLFGHVHGGLNDDPLGFSLDVGVDSHDFRPWSVDEIRELFESRYDHFQMPHPNSTKKTTPSPSLPGSL